MSSSDLETIVVAFSPTDADYADTGHHWSLYTPDREDPLDVPLGTRKLHDAIAEFDPEDYPPQDGDSWSRLDWHSIMDGDPKRVDREGDHVE